MNNHINVFKIHSNAANIKQTSFRRDWMDQTDRSHAYHCFPVSLANSLGYEISFKKDISFIWNGIFNGKSTNVEILSGSEYAYGGRGHGTISFNTGLVIRTDENITMMTMPVPNLFVDGVQTFTTLFNASLLKIDFPLALKITRPNVVITIPANQPVATIVPVPLKEICDFEMNIYSGMLSEEDQYEINRYGEEAQKINKIGNWTDWYRNATNYKDEPIGKHELKNIKLVINDYTDNERRVVS